VRQLLDQVLRLLPVERQEEQRRRRSAPRLQLPAQPESRVDPGVLRTVKRAINERRELRFLYWSTFDIDAPRQHRVAPYGIFFRPEGHTYLDATLLEVKPVGGETIHAAIDYRLDRIVPGSVRVLPTMLPPERIVPRFYPLRYHLLPVVARRRDVAAYFPNTQIEYHDDGSATVTATVTNLWQARQVLLRYGDACTVLSPPELIEMFRRTAQGLWENTGLQPKGNSLCDLQPSTLHAINKTLSAPTRSGPALHSVRRILRKRSRGIGVVCAAWLRARLRCSISSISCNQHGSSGWGAPHPAQDSSSRRVTLRGLRRIYRSPDCTRSPVQRIT